MSLALYRTYRPGRLADVIGQEHVTVPLMRALDSQRIHHAYLFSGPRGCGKTSSARILARAINCEAGMSSDPCGKCQSCIDLAPNGPGSIDVIEMDAATNRGIDDTRELREKAVFAPVRSRYKVYIIDEAHQLTREAFNVLLKLVEEPPEHLKFVFATTEVDKIQPTMRSRTHNYAFRLVPAETLQAHLAHICEVEGVSADPAALALVARAGEGSVRDSLSVLGQVIAGSGPDGVTYAEAVAQLGYTDDALLSRIVAAIAAGDGAAMFELIAEVTRGGQEPRRFAGDLLERLRDMIVISQLPEAGNTGMFDLPPEQVADLAAQSQLFDLAHLVRVADAVSDGLLDIRGSQAPRLQLELLAAKLVVPQVLADLEQRVLSLELGGGGGSRAVPGAPRTKLTDAVKAAASAPAAPEARDVSASKGTADDGTADERTADEGAAPAAATKAPPAAKPATKPAASSSAPAPRRPSQVAAGATKAAATKDSDSPPTAKTKGAGTGALTIDVLRENWPQVLTKVAALRKVSGVVFHETAPMSLSDGVLAVAFPSPGVLKNATSGDHVARLQSVIAEMFDATVSIEGHVDNSVARPTAKVSKPDVVETGDADPDDANATTKSAIDMLQEALGAQVVESDNAS